MVSKIIKKTPTKSLKECRGSHRRKKTPLTPKSNISAASSVVIAAINESLFTCHRRLVKIFSKLVCMSTPNKKSPKRQGFQKLIKSPIPEEQEQAIRFQIPPKNVRKPLFFGLPPLTEPHTKTIFLDLDETLIHSKPEPPPEKYDFVVRPTIDGEMINFYVLKRPGVDEFLEFLSERFEIVVFTAGLKEYASLVLDALDRNGVISHRLYRDSCREMEGKFVKDLSEMGRDLTRVVIVDDNPSSYVFQPGNAIPVRPFVDDLGDRELLRLMEFLDLLDGFDDIREAVKLFDSPRQP